MIVDAMIDVVVGTIVVEVGMTIVKVVLMIAEVGTITEEEVVIAIHETGMGVKAVAKDVPMNLGTTVHYVKTNESSPNYLAT